MLNIWQNSFYWKPPALSWNFDANFNNLCDWSDDDFTMLGLDLEESNPLNKAIVSVTIPDRETQMESLFYGGMEFPQYTRANNAGTVTIKFNEDNKYTISRILEAIYNKYSYAANCYPDSYGDDRAYRETPSDPEDIEALEHGTQGNIEIRVFKYSGIANSSNPEESDYCYSINFFGCKLVKIDGFELSYESEDTITRTATFSYTHMFITDEGTE